MLLNTNFRAFTAFCLSAMVRLSVVALLATVALSACSEKKKTRWTHADITNENVDDDWFEDNDSDMDDELFEEEPMPLAAEELFDDFFFNFATSRKVQMERIALPLQGGHGADSLDADADSTAEGTWQMDHFFMNQDYYTVIFDRPEFMDFVKDTTVSEAVVEKINFADGTVSQYMFDRREGRWMLRQLSHQPIADNANAAFLTFYHRFVTDSVFQRESLADEIVFRGSDPEDEDQELEGLITPDFWDAFAPELPKDLIYNIVYDRHQDAATAEKLFVMRGISNGSELKLTFRKDKNEWKLEKLIE